jgi:hypothetical protein
MHTMQPIKELEDVTRERFERDVLPAYEPVVMRGIVRDWPLVAQGRAGLEPCLQYLIGFDSGRPVDAVLARPEPTRAFSYKPGLDGFNFTHDKRPYAALFEQLWRYSQFPEPPSLAAQSALVAEALPGLERTNPMPLLDSGVAPRIWIGNRATVPAHFDDSHNIACVAAGRRRFTLLPPTCAPLLYLGPPDYAPTCIGLTLRSSRSCARRWRRPSWPSWSQAMQCTSHRCGSTKSRLWRRT